MIIREELSKYNFYFAKMSKIELEIHRLENENTNLKSPVIDGLPRASGFSGSTMEEKIVKNLEKIAEKRSRLQELKDIIDLLNKLIRTLKENQQRVIRLRYIENKDIKAIAELEFKEYRTVQANIDTAISEMQKNFNELDRR